MSGPSYKLAILHADGEVAGRVSRAACAAHIDVVTPPSLADLINQGDDPFLCAIVVGEAVIRDSRAEALISRSRAHLLVIAAGESPALLAFRRQAEARNRPFSVFFKTRLDDQTLLDRLRRAKDGAPSFGPAELAAAIDQRYFRVEYQPKVPLFPSATLPYGVEALCRVTDPRFGAISPDRFIPMAEQHGLIARLTDAVVRDSLRDWGSWHQAGLDLKLAVNVSPLLVQDGTWSEGFLRICSGFGIEPKWITLEITESSAGATAPAACEVLTRLRDRGFTLSIDDFGTGFSALSNLYRLPVSELKIDKSFILDLQAKAGARSLVESTIGMAQRMGLKVVAEGVESEALFDELRRMGCHEAQGFYISRSMPAAAVVAFFAEWKKKSEARVRPALAHPMQGMGFGPVFTGASVAASVATAPAASRPSAEEILAGISPLVLEGKRLEALALCQEACRVLDRSGGDAEIRVQLMALRAELERELPAPSGIEIENGHARFRLLAGGSASLGRPAPGSAADIAIRCRWISSGDRSLRLFAEAGHWFIEDRGSTHGYRVDGRRLLPRKPYGLPSGRTTLDIGLASGGVAPLSLILHRPASSPRALTLTFDYDVQALKVEIGREQWPALERDVTTNWILFDGDVTAGKSPHCGIVLEDCTVPIAATIRFEDGLWIDPQPEAVLRAGETRFTEKMPLPVGAKLNLAGAELRIAAPRAAESASLLKLQAALRA